MKELDSIRKSSAERRRFPLPKKPGNYPEDYIQKIKDELRQYPGNTPLDKNFNKKIAAPRKSRGVLLCADIRNFTKTYEEHGSKKVQPFLNVFFKRASDIINKSKTGKAFINKFLGDGLFAHISDDYDVEKAVEAARKLILFANGTKKGYDFRYANLSVALTESDYTIGPVGGKHYMDYTLYGPSVNSLFRMLSQTGGGLIWVTDAINRSIIDTHFLVYVGDLKFKGIIPTVTTYSLIRKKEKKETLEIAMAKCNDCFNYNLCKRAWEKGKEDSTIKPNEYLFNLDCNECGEENTQCWLWGRCIQKLDHVNAGKPIRCCYMCKNFRNCFHSYQLGRQGQNMISCDMALYENFII